ncbi:MAG: LysE family translocator [Rhodospirillales bacterium]|nr:LysE family translocator [Rhodospirillales bacterium]
MDGASVLNLVLATLVFVLSPGPANLAVLATSASHGFRSGFLLAVGEVIGAVLYLLIALFSLGALASVLAPMMVYVKLAGAMYLVYLGYKQFTSKDMALDESQPARSPLKQMMVGFLINGTNPKLVVFYLSFLPLFVDLTTLTPLVGGQIVLTVAATLLAGISLVCILGQQLRRLMKRPGNARWVNRTTGVIMMGVGVSVARS